MDTEITPDASLRQMVYNEIKELVQLEQHAQEVSRKISYIFTKELEKRTQLTAQELSKKYEAVIEQKTHNEEIAWEKYKKVLSEKRDTEAVIKSIAEGLIVVDAEGKVVMMNPAAEKILGISAKDKIGTAVTSGIKEEQLISLVKSSPEKEEKEIELFSPEDSTKKVIRASTAVIEDEDGRTVGMVSVLNDITKQKELDQLKSNFVASVSHELRTPLVAMEKSLSLILDQSAGPVTEQQQQFLSIVERNLKRLTNLINDLLDLSKLEAGKMQIKPQPTSIESVINESIQTLKTWANTKSIEIQKDIQPDLPQVNIDSNRIIQVLNNLIGNSIKFTPANGKITVSARLESQKNHLEVSVQDTGIGIPKEALPKVFDKFYQVGERTSSDISGTGIGLAVAKEIVELHGGRIWAESEYGQGAKFTFTLPLSSNTNIGGQTNGAGSQ